jgi:hypothetical protein
MCAVIISGNLIAAPTRLDFAGLPINVRLATLPKPFHSTEACMSNDRNKALPPVPEALPKPSLFGTNVIRAGRVPSAASVGRSPYSVRDLYHAVKFAALIEHNGRYRSQRNGDVVAGMAVFTVTRQSALGDQIREIACGRRR